VKTVSLVIPATPGDARFVPELLRTVNRGTVLPDEIVVSVSMGDRLPGELVEEIQQAFGAVTRGRLILSRDKLLAAANRNLGGAAATGDVFAFFDADDVPHPQLFEVVRLMFENDDIVHMNHCIATDPAALRPVGRLTRVGSDVLVPLYFPNGRFEECLQRTGAYGGGLPPPISAVAAGHTYVTREAFEKVKFRDPDARPWPQAEDYLFCMEMLYQFRRSVIVDAVLSLYRPSSARGADRHG
jgi:Glycosyl transferase family 2